MTGPSQVQPTRPGTVPIYKRAIEFFRITFWLGVFVGGVGIGADDIHGESFATLVVLLSVAGFLASIMNFIKRNRRAVLVEAISYFLCALSFFISIFLAQAYWGELTIPYILLTLFCLTMGIYGMYTYRKVE